MDEDSHKSSKKKGVKNEGAERMTKVAPKDLQKLSKTNS
jgi:hypothetical protein